MTKTTIVIPCYNEEHRLGIGEALALLARPELDILFVDDGSTDNTLALLGRVEKRAPGRVSVLALPKNRGKAEAVRAGLNHALARGARIVGYLDADMATPASELLRLLDIMLEQGAAGVMGARVRLLGGAVERRRSRQYLGQVFSFVAELALGVPVADTQCGAKLFRRTPALEQALAARFRSRWAFDVELLARLMARAGENEPSLLEVPLRRWHDVDGSKLSLGQMLKSGIDLARIALDTRRARGALARDQSSSS